MSNCPQCQAQFEIPKIQKDFLEKMSLPDPKLCPHCRRQRRFAFRNERQLYQRQCDLTGKQIISIYASDSPYKVYDQHEWHSDKWNAFHYSRDFDFSRSFFEQMGELMLDVPKISVFASRNENSDYANGAQQDKNCYMIFVSDHDEDCYYSYGIDSCQDCLECLNCYKCELCIESIDCSECYNVAYGEKSHGCRDCYFISDCKGCSNCFGCYGLRNKEYYFFNEKLSKEEYEKKLKELNTGNIETINWTRNTFAKKKAEQQIHQYYNGNNNQDVTGDHIVGCKNCIDCYDSGDLEDCAYLIFSFKSKDCFDGHVVVDKCELCSETVSTINQYNTQFTFCSWYSKNSQYLDHCVSCKDCFACSGLKNAQYCVFNKQYTREEYEELRARIIEYMKRTGEYGEFFPIALSPFGYNETVASEYYPLSREQVSGMGWKWREEDSQTAAYQGPQIELPSDIEDASEDISEKILLSEASGKPYKITPQELNLYRLHKLPLPRMRFDERHMDRIRKRNPRNLWKRDCRECGASIESTYSPDRPETVYCEGCYLKEVY
ncbi:MAG: hypothetical protein ABII07_00480 [Patescibacteria group bacterium]|nr:hypothetical protein [Patescibacteria group bacterium]